MGESVIREAKQKAESLLREAGIRADTLTRVAQEQSEEQQQELERVKAEVAHFKNTLLAMYKQHIELISGLPGDEEIEEAELVVEAVEPVREEEPQPQPAEEMQPEQAPVMEEPKAETMQFPDLAELYGEQSSEPAGNMLDTVEEFFEEDFSAQTFSQEPVEEPKQAEQPEQAPAFQGFKGIQFTD